MKKVGIVQGLIALSSLAVISCNSSHDRSGLTVAGGTIDADGEYVGTFYVDITADDFGTPTVTRQIRNVGTVVDVGHATKYALIVSLADAMVDFEGYQALPVFKTVNVKLISSDSSNPISLDPMEYDVKSGQFMNGGQTYPLVAVGLKAQAFGSPKVPFAKVASAGSKMLLEDPLMVGSKNLRIQDTSYLMIAVPKSKIPFTQGIAKILPSDQKDSSKSFEMVGYGEMKYNSSASSDKSLALSSELSNIQKRNYASVSVVSNSPLSKLIGTNSSVASQLWEVEGSALCGSSDGKNYDTGAAIYQDKKFVGFGVKSTRKSANYVGKIISCTSKDVDGRKDMVTLVVSPSAAAVNMFVQALGN